MTQEGSESAPKATKSASRGPREAPRQEAPTGAQEASKRLPRDPQEAPRSFPRHPRRSKRRLGPPRGPQNTPRGLHWGTLPLCAAHFPYRGNSSGHRFWVGGYFFDRKRTRDAGRRPKAGGATFLSASDTAQPRAVKERSNSATI
eukprot:2930074-Pyramimonas_sp.AAC.1